MSYRYFENKECEYYPCHRESDGRFNCIFCYCPLYALGDACGGDFSFTEEGIKSCENCMIPHSEEGYEYIISRFEDIKDIVRKRNE